MMKLLDSLRNNIDSDYRNLQDSKIDAVPSSVTPTEIIASTFKIYGSIFLICFALFLALRSKFPLVYTFNSRAINQMTPLSKHRYGPVKWMYKIFTYSDDEIFTHCGMTAIVYLRFLRLGFKLSCVGIFNSFYLIPANLHGCNSDGDECLNLTDQVEKLSFGHISNGSDKIWATIVAAYVIFGSAMYLIFHEFKWYTEYRHNFCIKPRPDNYTVYVAHIPEEYRSDSKLLHYFQSIFSEEDVLDAKVALDLNHLENKVVARKKVLQNLEHAVNIRDVKGYEPMRGNPLGGKLPSIPTFTSELNDLNKEISNNIEKIESKKESEAAGVLGIDCMQDVVGGDATHPGNAEGTSLLRNDDEMAEGPNDTKEKTILSQIGSNTFRTMKDTVGVVGKTVGGTVTTSVTLAKSLIGSTEDGTERDAGFVTFSTLLAKNQCQQIIHHSTPFTFYTMAAPRPEDIVWDNVGLPHKQQQISHLLAQVATVATCIFWTIPVSFFASLSEVENLKELIPGLEKALERNKWLAPFLANLSPLMLVILTSLLPLILTVYCKREGHAGVAELNASLLTKLSSFMIIQIFFVQALSGSITAALYEIIEDWTRIVELMATTIPVQVTSFIQYVQVKNFLGCSIEILRIARVAMALLRKRVGPNLTEKERNTPWMGILPMVEPEEVEYPMRFAEMILYFMINLVYSCIAPIMSYMLLICFGILSLVFRHQLIYTYSKTNDDGGKMWSSAIMLLITCMIVSEITLIGMIFLKKAFIAGVALVPLIVCSFLFLSYIKQQHFRVIEYVPSTLCSKTDKANHDNLDLSFLKDQYLQAALKKKFEFPENMQHSDVEAYDTSEKKEEL
jgi:hypothetical protein